MAAPQVSHAELLDDRELVERLRSGDEQAFDELYERYFKRIAYFVGRRIDNRADAEETVQEVFINVFASIGSYRGEAPFVAWIFGLTRRTIAGRFKRKRHPTVPMEEDESDTPVAHPAAPSVVPTPDQVYDCTERAAQLETYVADRLSADQRALFVLHHLEERPISEIAERLGKSEDSIKSSLYRTRKLLLAT
jgi:RNA polymerase sigma-70 factor (ECF subfamily)